MRPTKRGYRLTPRSERGLQLAEKAKATQIAVCVSGKIYEVQSASGQGSYIVNLDPLNCTCPDWRYRGQGRDQACKHIIAAALQHVGC